MNLPQPLSVFCPAKLNLSLLVYPPISTGYHPIYSIFQPISLGDMLEIQWLSTPGFQLELVSDFDAQIEVDSNILTRIYRRFSDRIPVGVSLRLIKHIPVGGGLGGGSTNAASFLTVLNQYFLHLSPSELASIALDFGSDIPFFLTSGTALVTGIGEQVTLLPDAPFSAYILIIPPFSILSKTIYQALDQFG